ncbi:hypothetical protein SLE2022_237760 [Rubroshorea leprosula]
MNFLLELNLGGNKLSGSIPRMPPRLQVVLNLSSNLFHGTIPDSLSQLTSLEVLDLSNDRFSGEVPDSLVRLLSLTQLILSNNQLSGVLPQFSKHLVVNISGNPHLIKNETRPPNTSPASEKKKASVTWTIVVGVEAFICLLFGILCLFFHFLFPDKSKGNQGRSHIITFSNFSLSREQRIP